MQLTTAGMKARDHLVEIDGLSLLVGPNGSGKSSIADAIRFLALGYVPSLGKRPQDTAVLMSDRELSVEISLPNGRSIRRTLTRTEKSYTVGAECSWLRNAKPSQASQEIMDLFGAEEQDVAECLDIRQLLAATPNQRAARIEQFLSAGKRPPEETAAAIARLTVQRLIDIPDDRMPKDYLQALPMVADGHVEILREVAGMLLAKVTETGITGALSWANEEKRSAANGLRQKEQAEAELRLRAVEVPEPDGREITRLEEERDKLQRTLGVLSEQRREHEARKSRRVALEAAIGQIKERCTLTWSEDEEVREKQIADLQEKSRGLMEELEALQSPVQPNRTLIAELLEEQNELNSRLAEVGPIPAVPMQPAELMAAVEMLNQRMEEAESSPWAEVLDIALGLKKAKTALAKARRLEELARAALVVTADDLKHEITIKRKELAAAVKAREEATKATEEVEAKRKAIEERRDAICRKVHELEISYDQEWNRATVACNVTRNKLLAQRRVIEGEIEDQRKALQALRDDAAAAQRRRASLVDELRGIGEPGEAPQDAAVLEEQLGHVREALDRLTRAGAVHAEIQTVLKSIEAAKARRDVCAAIEWALQRQREIEISSSGGPLLRTMQKFFIGAGRTEQPFIRAAAGSCAIGWRTLEGDEIQVQALSGGEWSLFAAALTSAVILCRKSNIKVLLVEAGETDDRHLAQILAGVRSVSEGGKVLDAIVMVPRSPTFAVAGWTTVSMTEEMRAAEHAA